MTPFSRIFFYHFLRLPLFVFSMTLLHVGGATPVWGKANFTVAPGIVEFDISRPVTKSFLIINSGDEKIRLFIRPVYFPIDSRSLSAGKHLNQDTEKIEDLTSIILVSPRVLSLSPGQRRNIRISVRPTSKLAPGDYRAHLLIRSLGEEKEEKKENPDQPQQGMSIQLDIKLETAVAIYGQIGQPNTRLEWKCGFNEAGDLEVTAINKSPWRFSGWVTIETEVKTPIHEPLRLVSLRESVRPLVFGPTKAKEVTVRWGEKQDALHDSAPCPPAK